MNYAQGYFTPRTLAVLGEFEKGGQTVAKVASTLGESERYVQSVASNCLSGGHKASGVSATRDRDGVIILRQEEIPWAKQPRAKSEDKPAFVVTTSPPTGGAAESLTLSWHPLQPADRVRTGDLGVSGVYAWIWPGVPDRVRYIGMAGASVGSRLADEFRIYRAGGFNQFNVSDDTDFFCFFAKYWNDPNRVLLGVARLQDADETRKAWARKSLPHLRFTWAPVPVGANIHPMMVEAKLISDVRSQVKMDTRWEPPQKFHFPAKIDNRMTPSQREFWPRLSLTHEGFSNASALFGPSGQKRC